MIQGLGKPLTPLLLPGRGVGVFFSASLWFRPRFALNLRLAQVSLRRNEA